MKCLALIPVLSAAALAVPFLVFADDSFIPLTSIPGITSLTGSPTLPAFLNNLYRICIGIAAFAAIARFIYAGYTIMTDSGSVTKNKKAREMIQNTVIGLILVLSPAVVFGIINPKILDLSLDFKGLQSNNGTGGDAICYPACDTGFVCDGGKCVTQASVEDTSTGCSVIANGATLGTIKEQNCCQAQSGCKVQISGTNALAKPTCACTK